MTMTINQQFVDLAQSAWMDTETRSFYLDKFSPATANYDDFVGEVMGRNLDTLRETYAAIGRDFISEFAEWGGTGVSDRILFLWEEDDLPFLMMMWDMAADGWLDGGSDSIGRMEDYDEMDDVSEPDDGSMVGKEYDDPEGRWLIVGQAHDVVNIRCIESGCHPEGFQSCVPIEEARHYLTHDWTNW